MSKEKLYLKLTNQDLSLYDNGWHDITIEEEYDLYMELAVGLIENYLGVTENDYIDILYLYGNQCVMLASHVYSLHKSIIASDSNVGIKSINSNGRSITFVGSNEIYQLDGIPKYILDALPKPKAKVKAW